MNVLEIFNKANGEDCNESELKIDIHFPPEVAILTKSEDAVHSLKINVDSSPKTFL